MLTPISLDLNSLPEAAVTFLQERFTNVAGSDSRDSTETAVEASIIAYVEERFSSMKYILGLAIDFTILAESLSLEDISAREFRPTLKEDDIFRIYTLVEQVGTRQANTLTLSFKNGKNKYGIRKTEEQVVSLFHKLHRTAYPSAYVYNTGQWKKFKDLLVMCFRLSPAGRLSVCSKLIVFGLEKMQQNTFYGRSKDRPRVYEAILRDYERSADGENGGLAFQAIAFGYITTDRPHLDISAAGVRTGSARQRRFGDVDCYYGLDLELSVEVKDLKITENNLSRELGTFMSEIASGGIMGMAIVQSIDPIAAEHLRDAKIVPYQEHDLLAAVSAWDWPKQNQAVHRMLHYLAHIEQNPAAVKRLLCFISRIDEEHESLVFLKEK
jgi:hypothetical protein